MPDNENPQVINHCNNSLRVFADSMVTAYETCRKFIEQYEALGIAALCPDNTDPVADGSALDGRPIIQNQLVRKHYASATTVRTWFEANHAGDNVSRITRFRQAAVNGRSQI